MTELLLILLIAFGFFYVAAKVWARPTKPCPACAEDIQRDAVVCRYCGVEFGP